MSISKKIVLVQPPFTQINSPYPAPYYLKRFLEERGFSVEVQDHSIGLFERIFCAEGLTKIFADAETMRDKSAPRYTKGVFIDERRRLIADRYFSEKDKWIAIIDRVTAFLRGSDVEFAHFLCLANGVIPGGPRFDAALDRFDGQPPVDAAGLLASALLEDIADFITVTLDPAFSPARYAASLSGSAFASFSAVLPLLDGYLMREFYRPYLEQTWRNLESASVRPLLIGITIPFIGCLTGALVCASSAKLFYKKKGGRSPIIMAGGGYVNTELRTIHAAEFFDFIDFLSFDKGYGSLASVLDFLNTEDSAEADPISSVSLANYVPIYKTLFRLDGMVRGSADDQPESLYYRLETKAVTSVFPDYGGVDFSCYPRIVEDENPMHRLWSDGHWLKVFLAYGCYWRKCAFCDTSLDYIRDYHRVDTDALFRHLVLQAEKTGVRGVHLVDEAAPPASLLRLAALNRAAGLPLQFWGNIRFEKSFTPDTAALLAAGGLIGVSGGIEIASEAGFRRVGKGIALSHVVNACAAFKEQGILTHAYLIYGYYDEDEREIVDSAEILRQLFQAGLLDSAFWHKFVLTRHSRLCAEHERGAHPDLAVIEPAGADFALNDLSFKGENRFDKWSAPLDALLTAWMAGDYRFMFPFKTLPPRVKADTVFRLLDAYAKNRDAEYEAVPTQGELVFLGSRPVIQAGEEQCPRLYWRYRLEDHVLKTTGADAVAALQSLLFQAADGVSAPFFRARLGEISPNPDAAWRVFRGGGLVFLQNNQKIRKIQKKFETTRLTF